MPVTDRREGGRRVNEKKLDGVIGVKSCDSTVPHR